MENTTEKQKNKITFTNTFLPRGAMKVPKSIVCDWNTKGYGSQYSLADDFHKYKTSNEVVKIAQDNKHTWYDYPTASILNCTDDDEERYYPVLMIDFDKKDNEVQHAAALAGDKILSNTITGLLTNCGLWMSRSGGIHLVLFLDNCKGENAWKAYQYYYHMYVKVIEEASGWKTDPKVLSERRNLIVPIHPKEKYRLYNNHKNIDCQSLIDNWESIDDEYKALVAIPAKKTTKAKQHTTTTKIIPQKAVFDKYSNIPTLLDFLINNGAIDKCEKVDKNGKQIIRIYMNGEDATTPLNWYCYGEGYFFYSYTNAETKLTPSEWFYKIIAKTDVVQGNVEWWDEWARKYFYFVKLRMTNTAGWSVIASLHGEGVEFYEDKFEQRIYAIESANPNVIRQNKKPQELTSNLLRKLESDYPDSFFAGDDDEKKPTQIQKSQYLPNLELYAHEHGKNRMVDSLKADLERVKAECPELLDKTPQEVCREMVDAVFGDKVENKALLVEAMAKFTFASVARAITDNPDGFKFDNCIVLEGKQGIRKSTFCQFYCGAEFHESMGADAITNHKDMVLSFDGKRVIELEECSKITRQRDANHIKAHLSQATDTIRKPYAAETFRHVRRYVHIATTNDSEFLKDTTGNRRFWCVKCTHNPKKKEYIKAEWLKTNRWRMWGYFYNLIQSVDEDNWHQYTILPHVYEMAFEDIANNKIHESDTTIQIRMWFDKVPMSDNPNTAKKWNCFDYHTAIDAIFANAASGDFAKTMDQKQYNYYSNDFKAVAKEYGYEYIRNRSQGKIIGVGEYRWCRDGVVPDAQQKG